MGPRVRMGLICCPKAPARVNLINCSRRIKVTGRLGSRDFFQLRGCLMRCNCSYTYYYKFSDLLVLLVCRQTHLLEIIKIKLGLFSVFNGFTRLGRGGRPRSRNDLRTGFGFFRRRTGAAFWARKGV